MPMSVLSKPAALNDADLDAAGGVYVQEIPSGAKDRRAGHGILLVGYDESAVRQPDPCRAVFEPNSER